MDGSEDIRSPPSSPAKVAVFPEVIKLNVGGHFFTISLSTLTNHQFPSKMLAGMFSGRNKVAEDEQGRYFIDRDGTHFHYILDYIRGKQLDPSVALRVFVDAQYYKVPGLIEWCKSQPVYLARELKCLVQQRCVKDESEHTTFQMRILEDAMDDCKGEDYYEIRQWTCTPSAGAGKPLTVKRRRITIAQSCPEQLPEDYSDCKTTECERDEFLFFRCWQPDTVQPAIEMRKWYEAHEFATLSTCDRKPLMFIAERGRFPESENEVSSRLPTTLDFLIARFNNDLCDSGIALTEIPADSKRVRCYGCKMEVIFQSFELQLKY